MATPKPKFHLLGKSKFVHTVYTNAYDVKKSQCQQVRKYVVAGKVDYKSTGISADAALALDSCEACATHEVIKQAQSPEEKRAKRKADANDLLEKIRDEQPGRKKAKGKPAKADKPVKEKVAKVAKPTTTKSGMRSVGSNADSKARALADFMTENGWSTTIGKDEATGHVVVAGTNGDQNINAFFIDGKYDVSRHAVIAVGAWSGTLRGAHAVRRQVDTSLDDRDRPHPAPGKGRKGPRKKVDAEPDEPVEGESPEDARRRVPFSLDDPDVFIIDTIKGHTIRWRNGVSGNVEEATVPGSIGKGKRPLITVNAHPKTGRRILDFIQVIAVNENGEVYGPERAVYLDKIVRVAG